MFCQNCGKEIPDGVAFCPHCGVKNKHAVPKNSPSGGAANEKNMVTALVISFLLVGLGIAYAGNKKRGIILFVAGIFFGILGLGVPICHVISLLIWAYALYDTYNQVKIANGQNNPNIIEDFKTWDGSKKAGVVIVVLVIVLIVVAGSISAFAPKTVNDDYMVSDYDSDYIGSDAGSSSGASESYSSSSDGHEVSSHYEGEYGSSDTEGIIHDDGSVDSHQKGHTDYGDYEIDSHMDSDGNIHGTVDVGGRTYHVSS